MWFFYLFALAPVAVGAALWVKYKKIVWFEWAIPSAAGFALAILFQILSIYGMTHDVETWSGTIQSAVFYPRWVEEYTTVETETDSKGNTHTKTVVHHNTHHEYWEATADLGNGHTEDVRISESEYANIEARFGPREKKWVWKSGFDSGDHNIYPVANKSGYFYPVAIRKSWTNKIKAAPSLFSYSKPPKSIPVFEYPDNPTDRLLGTARSKINQYKWDCMNSRLGPAKYVNVILIGFDSDDSQLGHYQESKWIGGKKNDLVICFGHKWSYVFGWTDQTIVKRNLETIALHDMNDDIIPLMEDEISRNYIIKDWSKFDYIKVEPPSWSYIVYILALAITQIGIYAWAFYNDKEKT